MTTLDLIRKTIQNTRFENKTFIAGGFVRDQVMGIDSNDIDIVVNLPDGGIELALFLQTQLPGQTSDLVVYERFGTAMLVIAGEQIEFVETRKEKYTPGSRKPETVFGTLKDDVYRRDLTINSLLQNVSTNEILDLTGKGLDDIASNTIRTTNTPDSILAEDPLRILRAVRFASRFGGSIDHDLLDSMSRHVERLFEISSERIQTELVKMFGSSNVTHAISVLDLIGFWSLFLPEWNACVNMEQNRFHTKTVDQHIMDVVANCPKNSSWQIRLAAFLHDIGKSRTSTVDSAGQVHFLGHENISADITDSFLRNLKFSNQDRNHICDLVRNHMRIKSDTRLGKVRKLVRTHGRKFVDDLLVLITADVESHRDNDSSWIEELKFKLDQPENNPTSEQKLVSGNELMELFDLKPGPEVGRLKNSVQELVDENPNITKEQVLNQLDYTR